MLSVLLNGENGSTSVVCAKLGLLISNFLVSGRGGYITGITARDQFQPVRSKNGYEENGLVPGQAEPSEQSCDSS